MRNKKSTLTQSRGIFAGRAGHGIIISVVVLFLMNFTTALVQACFGTEYYVDAGSIGGPAADENPGTKERPGRAISRAFSGKEPFF